MLTLSQLKRALAFKAQFPSTDGACFGVTDPSRLRPAWPTPARAKPAKRELAKKRVPVAAMTAKKKKKKE